MEWHLFATFDEDTARAPLFLESFGEHEARNVLSEEQNRAVEEACKRSLANAYGTCKPSSRKLIQLKRNGFALDAGAYCQYETADGVHAMFAGEVSKWPGVDAVAVAHDAFVRGEPESGRDEAAWLLEYYNTFKDTSQIDVSDAVLAALAHVEGVFAFVLYDEALQRVMVARDRDGASTLYWGSTPDGRFMVGSCLRDLEACRPSATPFPAGSLYASQGPTMAMNPGEVGWIMPGEPHHGSLFSFVKSSTPGKKWRAMKAIPRLTQEGTLCGAVYKVASEANLAPLAGC